MISVEEKQFCEEFIATVLDKPTINVNTLKINLAAKYKVSQVPKTAFILMFAPEEHVEQLISILHPKPVRELSGVTVVSLFSKPHFCPHGSCTFCPGGPKSPFGNVPKAYTGQEPAALRAQRNQYDPYLQVFNRLEHYVINGHFPDKIEIILMGGTFPSLDKEYRDEFIMYMYKAFNDFGELFIDPTTRKVRLNAFRAFFHMPRSVDDTSAQEEVFAAILQHKMQNVKTYQDEILRNEQGILRCIGLTIETKPDWCLQEHCEEMLNYGATRIEIGVQSLFDDVLTKTHRGHDVQTTKDSFAIAKDLCFKLNAHVMLGLPSSSREKDHLTFVKLFEGDYEPDMMKIYPTLVLKGTKLYADYKKGNFQPISTQEAASRIIDAYTVIPEYVRVMRVQRDIPTTLTEEGVRQSNLRQIVEEQIDHTTISPKEIRYREIGLVARRQKTILDDFGIKTTSYPSCGGHEYFISYENSQGVLIGFVRLRLPGACISPFLTPQTALIRELHVYGQVVAVGESNTEKMQHKGIGKLLMQHAEEIAYSLDFKHIAVISGIGVREYYAKLGYHKQGPYMQKELISHN